MRKAIMAAILAGVVAAATEASARDLPAGGLSATELAEWLKGHGYSAIVKPDPSTPGDEIVSSASGGVNWDIYLYQCTSGRCRSIQYAAGWTSQNGDAERVAVWNRDKRYLRAYLSAKSAPFAEYDIDIAPGGTWEMLDHTLTRWVGSIPDFKTYIGR